MCAVLLLAGACDSAQPTPAAPSAAPTAAKRVVGYFTEWGVHSRNFQVRDVESSGAASRLTHLVYAFGQVTDGRCATSDSWVDHQNPIAAAGSDRTAERPVRKERPSKT
jgi:chitinase